MLACGCPPTGVALSGSLWLKDESWIGNCGRFFWRLTFVLNCCIIALKLPRKYLGNLNIECGGTSPETRHLLRRRAWESLPVHVHCEAHEDQPHRKNTRINPIAKRKSTTHHRPRNSFSFYIFWTAEEDRTQTAPRLILCFDLSK